MYEFECVSNAKQKQSRKLIIMGGNYFIKISFVERFFLHLDIAIWTFFPSVTIFASAYCNKSDDDNDLALSIAQTLIQRRQRQYLRSKCRDFC